MYLIRYISNLVKVFFRKNGFPFLLFLLVLFAFVLRYFHTKYGLPYLYFYDEPQTARTALKMMITGDFNPHFFSYGSMMIYSNLIVDILHYLFLMGQPVTANSYLTNIHDIVITAKTGAQWAISHPSFYLWNRVLTAIMGTLTVFVTFLIAKHIFNKWIGLIAAFFLATLPFHISQSTLITTDAPVSLFVLTTVLFSLLFIKYKKLSHFIISLVFVGISIATKYNAAISILVPLIAITIVYLFSKDSIKVFMWFLIPIVPISVFFIIMPYAILDFTSFLNSIGGEVHHYKVRGHFPHNSKPGIDHIMFQMNQFYKNIGLMNSLIIGFGFLGLFFRRHFKFVLLLPVIYILYMSGMKVNFHRNFVQVYPFIALLFASGLYIIYNGFDLIHRRFLIKKNKWIHYVLVVLISLLFLLPKAYSSFNTAQTKFKFKDTRTRSIDKINSFNDVEQIVIAEELKFHRNDLKRLKINYRILPLLEIASINSNKSTMYVLPYNIRSTFVYKKKKNKAELIRMNKFISYCKNDSSTKYFGRNNTHIYTFSVDPGLLFVKNLSNIPLTLKVDLSKCIIHPKPHKRNPLTMLFSGTITTPLYSLKKGKYKLNVLAKGTKAYNQFARLKIQAFKLENTQKKLFIEKIVYTKGKFSDISIPLLFKEKSDVSFVIQFTNDRNDPIMKEDRNVFFDSIYLFEEYPKVKSSK